MEASGKPALNIQHSSFSFSSRWPVPQIAILGSALSLGRLVGGEMMGNVECSMLNVEWKHLESRHSTFNIPRSPSPHAGLFRKSRFSGAPRVWGGWLEGGWRGMLDV